MKKIPSFWWDFRDNSIVIESDDNHNPLVTTFPIQYGDATQEINKAEKIIDDLESGRMTIKQAINILN